MQPFPLNIGAESVTAYIEGRPYTVARSPALDAALKARDWSTIATLMRPARIVEIALAQFGEVTVHNGHVAYRGQRVSNGLVDRILHLAREGLPFDPVAKCLNRLMKQDDGRVIASFHDYLERWHIPLKDDGRLVMCKGVRDDYRDTHTRTVDWTPETVARASGVVHNPPRLLDWDEVDRNPDQSCSKGYHAAPLTGAEEYARGGRLIAVYLCPSDIGAFPRDYVSNGKLRARYLFPAYEIDAETAARFGHAPLDPWADDYAAPFNGDNDW